MVQNRRIAANARALVAFWDGKSRVTLGRLQGIRTGEDPLAGVTSCGFPASTQAPLVGERADS